jgi:DNA transposition AAA+ family ATPase
MNEGQMNAVTTENRPDGFSRHATLAPLKNVAAMMGLVQRLKDRGAHMPGFGVVHGFSGYGKTYSAIFAQNKTGGARIEIGDSWTKKTLVSAILKELGTREPKGTVAELTEQVIIRLAEPEHPPLFIDEADKLVDKGMVELVREIQEGAQIPIVLIGEEMLPQKLMKIERVHNRVLDWVMAQPADLEDTRKLANLFCPSLAIDDTVLEAMRKASEGRARRIVTNLYRAREFAATRGLKVLGATGPLPDFFTGTPPARTRRVA